MNYEELAARLIEATHPKGKRPVQSGMEKWERARDMTLRCLYENGGRAAPGELAEFFGVSSARVARVLGELELRDMVTRESDPADRRRVIVRLTPAGEKHVLDLDASFRRRLGELLAQMGETDAREMVRLTIRMVEIMESRCEKE